MKGPQVRTDSLLEQSSRRASSSAYQAATCSHSTGTPGACWSCQASLASNYCGFVDPRTWCGYASDPSRGICSHRRSNGPTRFQGSQRDKEPCGIVIKDEEPTRRNRHVTENCAYTTTHP